MWFALLSGLGAVSMLTRSVPRMVAAGDEDGLRRLATSLAVLRAITGSCAAAGFFLIATLLLGEPDRWRPHLSPARCSAGASATSASPCCSDSTMRRDGAWATWSAAG